MNNNKKSYVKKTSKFFRQKTTNWFLKLFVKIYLQTLFSTLCLSILNISIGSTFLSLEAFWENLDKNPE